MKKSLNKILIINHYIRLYNSFFRGVIESSLCWDITNNFFSIQLYQNFSKKDNFLKIFQLLKHSTLDQLNCLVEITANQTEGSFFANNLTYCLLSIRFNYRLNVVLTLNKQFQKVDSLYKIFYSSIWLEREVWDLFGILFNKHPDLRRILTDYGFNGHPLQKNFPLVGFLDSVYSDTEKRVVYVSAEFTQAPRIFARKN
jgi:NADH-quinone oxidoreductase subunit C